MQCHMSRNNCWSKVWCMSYRLISHLSLYGCFSSHVMTILGNYDRHPGLFWGFFSRVAIYARCFFFEGCHRLPDAFFRGLSHFFDYQMLLISNYSFSSSAVCWEHLCCQQEHLLLENFSLHLHKQSSCHLEIYGTAASKRSLIQFDAGILDARAAR